LDNLEILLFKKIISFFFFFFFFLKKKTFYNIHIIFWIKLYVKLLYENKILIDSLKSAEGSCVLKMGKTSVVCGIKAEVAAPRVDDPRKGYIGKKYIFIKIYKIYIYIYIMWLYIKITFPFFIFIILFYFFLILL